MPITSLPKTTTTTAVEPPPQMNLKPPEARVSGNTKTCGFRLPKRRANLQPGKFLKKLGAKLAKATKMVSTRKQKSSCKVSSSSSAPSATLARSRSCADPITDNSHRAQAIEDCIEFLNSSSSLQRVNSVSSSSV